MSSPIEFNVFAPRNEAVHLVGSFTQEDIPMQKGEDGFFRVKVNLEDGQYQYKLRVKSNSPALQGQWVETNDPYMTEMDRKTENGVVRVKDGQRISDTYTWQHDRQPLPENRDVILYEMHIADFCGKGTDISDPTKFKQVLDKLDHLSELGINAIALMPVTEYDGDYRWGYMPLHFFALESSYGKPEDFKRLIDECHGRGIRVLIDCIFNHTNEESPLLKIDRDYWYYHDRHYPEDDANYWGPELSYENYDSDRNIRPTWNFVRDVVQFWIREYHIDGIRYDAVRQIANYEFFGWLFQQIEIKDKPFYQIAEHIPDTSEVCSPKGVFDACWHESFRYFLKDALIGQSVDLEELKKAIDARQQGYAGATSVINYLATHDREHMIVELGDVGIFDQPAFDRVKFGVILQLTAPGIPMIWMGDEFGQATHKTQTTLEPNQLDWSLLDHNRDLFEFYKRAIALRHEKSSLRTDNIEFFFEHLDDKVLAYVRWNNDGERVIVVANFSDQTYENYAIENLPIDCCWQDWSDGSEIEVNEGRVALDLPSFSAKVLLSQ
ncbi:alpha-amylase family glycosyl hydrolase [Leptolyngbya sp. FACHB-17]|uniref:alpha-amylase family glycosyl hydrolase n=1 Tax=unclassified Leptolyngbya TaxID=2650499 RepID=UPI0016806646|nr:alpha-amylase family glycosyl hydrolase [Leptolyngbya sp. FACHB-17]MBD2080350.1 alpha amylase C-terminal domain-containing protein [Leptolyngbya sp. FACHB-17]